MVLLEGVSNGLTQDLFLLLRGCLDVLEMAFWFWCLVFIGFRGEGVFGFFVEV